MAFAAEKNDGLTVQCDVTEYKSGSKKLNYILVAERAALPGNDRARISRELEYSPGVQIGIIAYISDRTPGNTYLVTIKDYPRDFHFTAFYSFEEGGMVYAGADKTSALITCKWINGAKQ